MSNSAPRANYNFHLYLITASMLLATDVQAASPEEYKTRISELRSSGKQLEAIEVAKDRVEEYPNDVEAYVGLAVLQNEANQISETRATCWMGLDVAQNPGDEEAGWNRPLEDRDEVYKTVSIINPSPELKESLFFLWFTLGLIEVKDKNFEEAILPLRSATFMKPTADTALMALAMTYLELRRFYEARDALQKIVDLGERGMTGGAMAQRAAKALERMKEGTGIHQ